MCVHICILTIKMSLEFAHLNLNMSDHMDVKGWKGFQYT